MTDIEEHKVFGLIGFPLSHSFSKSHFNNKFRNEHIPDSRYQNFPLPNISQFQELISGQPSLAGLNVTMPYKEAVIPFLDELDPVAREVGAVNTITIKRGDGTIHLKGFNTDITGFEQALDLSAHNGYRNALVLGSGGASKAVVYVLKKLCDRVLIASRKKSGPEIISYSRIDESVLSEYHLIVNTTPLGTWPDVDTFPPIPFEFINENHYLFDLVYNPEVSKFLLLGQDRGARIRNGERMLYEQAEASWRIWNRPL